MESPHHYGPVVLVPIVELRPRFTAIQTFKNFHRVNQTSCALILEEAGGLVLAWCESLSLAPFNLKLEESFWHLRRRSRRSRDRPSSEEEPPPLRRIFFIRRRFRPHARVG